MAGFLLDRVVNHDTTMNALFVTKAKLYMAKVMQNSPFRIRGEKFEQVRID
jgi:hypothetical protein